jgi:hypothetical protein
LEALRIIRTYLISKATTYGPTRDKLIEAIDDYAGAITGDRTALHSKTTNMGCAKSPKFSGREQVPLVSRITRPPNGTERVPAIPRPSVLRGIIPS